MYATTYVCEKLFSTMKIVKTKFRSRLTDKYLRDQLRLAGEANRSRWGKPGSDAIRSGAIACLLRNKGWEIHEGVHCISEDDSHRRADIIAINRQQQKAIIIDPTIRMERDLNQAHQVDHEKRAIYEPCIPYLSAKYNIPLFNWSVTGLFFGARCSLPRFTYNFLCSTMPKCSNYTPGSSPLMYVIKVHLIKVQVFSANDNSAYRCSANDKSALYRYKTASIDYSRICNRKRISEKSRRLEIHYCRRRLCSVTIIISVNCK
ncbi:hypothetical protein ANN_24097 [Periplaneta americana]|uniref:HAT C-terminal dimerisation domain-containing protein n=1 Tax=Periplaneta americana TaxID=6978 RepID=A0ABQ8S262_PERAM|nr:hypothetical protein ANN_24097 [Periplaneta americana]